MNSELQQKATLVVVGDRTANEVREAAEATGQFARVVQYYYDPATLNEFARQFDGLDVLFNVGIANPDLKVVIESKGRELGWQPSTIEHPSAIVSATARIEPGCFLGPLSVVSSNAVVGQGSIVHIHASIGHDAQLGANVAILPGARVSGNVKIGDNTIVGSNAFLAAGVSIGEGCRVDAQAYVASDLGDKLIVSPRSPHPVRRVV